ncbi:uncharacterized protein DDB_G0271670-like [Schistocerca cancellata]|uniref:uncharacterized protein DDB_G0271670-like n=1 Tax=Schistocerca cancellata TaxID=274614 RepID=UPI002117C49B|nr:uncharacterized protein DDB_G0271670-like [Schistocerca cancellata]XP_049784064.1 uncharacterized protein DDB_G0271670-like [Schistocerca cancellata]XP_049784065.1 uncharacterized protein DDB_G0271670-like [Schistocerca cancellata]XP_049784066.1 uncharacterized protein DDB_G0271670-like [Schistocerca cancellata]
MMMADESTGRGTVYFEVHVAINFVTSFMNKVVPQGRVKIFGEALARALMNKYEGHWFPESPLKGSAYRCFEFGAYIEPELKFAARQAGLRCRDVLICVPSEMSIWVDPGTVSYRIGIEGPVKPVLNESGCVVTCFFDPDVEDPEPDPPGNSKAVSSCEETETVEKSRPRKFTPKRGKAKLSVAYEDDLKFVAKNGGLDSATDYDDLEPLEPYFTAEDMKSGILCEDEELGSNQLKSSDEPAYGNSRRRRSRRSKKKSPNKPGNSNGNRGRNSGKRRQSNDSNNNSKVCSNNYQNSSGSASGSGSSSGASSSGTSIGGSTTSTSASSSGTSTSGTSCSSSSSSSSSSGGSSSGSGSSGGASSSSSSSITSSSSLTSSSSSSSCGANSGSNVNRSTAISSGRNNRGRNSRGGSSNSNGNSNPNNTNTSSNSSRSSNHHRNRNVLQHQSIVISNSSYSSRV